MAGWTLDVDDTLRPRKSPKKCRLDTDACSPGSTTDRTGGGAAARLLLYKHPGQKRRAPGPTPTRSAAPVRRGSWQSRCVARLGSRMAAAAPLEMGYPRRANGGGGDLLPARVDRGVARQLLDSGRAFMLLGALVLTWRRLARCKAEHVLAGFALWLLGAGLATLSLVAAQTSSREQKLHC
ncbi:hypothetical protein C2845_PM07G36540 [Panicum miliaceum]|uniref:Uncharacterized protein n=1 Tax=Panicum miliaceum TaxID=4540 RepID=A0A3L6SN31_PANMI|nr:hypothetical protein C2845_PM07G36540 [Panicum miliaceum]